jgi:hypothetical protein
MESFRKPETYMEAIRLIGNSKIIVQEKLLNQKLVNCMLDDLSDINLNDNALSAFFMIASLSADRNTTLKDVVAAFPKILKMNKDNMSVYRHVIDRLISGTIMPGGSEHLDQILKYLGLGSLQSFVHQFERDRETEKLTPWHEKIFRHKGDMKPYTAGMTYQIYHCEEPMEAGFPNASNLPGVFSSGSLGDLLLGLEDDFNDKLRITEDQLETWDETVFELISVNIQREGRTLFSLPFEARLFFEQNTKFSIREAVLDSGFRLDKNALLEIRALGRNHPLQNLLKGRHLEQDLGM